MLEMCFSALNLNHSSVKKQAGAAMSVTDL